MARPQADARLGYYPFPEPCIPALLAHLEPPRDPATCTLLDPCAGEGAAIAAIAAGLGVPDDGVYCVELSDSRANAIRANHAKFAILGPASFMGASIGYNVFSLVHLNPPYSSELGGGRREELTFLSRALNLLTPGGVLCFMLPETELLDWGQGPGAMRRTLSCRLNDIEVFLLPAEHRHYREVVVIGTRRSRPTAEPQGLLAGDRWWEARDRLGTLGTATRRHAVPPGTRPKVFKKIDFTPTELQERLDHSPLNRLLATPAAAPPPSPPLPPGRGHVALILASGDLDGLVCPPSEPPHVVRGTARKVRFRDQSKCESTVSEDGATTEKEVYSERIELIVRAIDLSGTIRTFINTPAEVSDAQASGSDGP